jgi:exonuclease III
MQSFLARGNSKYHLALLSRWPITARDSHHPFPPIQQTVLEASIACPNGQSLAVFGVHPVPRPFVVFELWRRWEMKVVLERVKRRAGSACLLLGDFNSSAPGDTPDVHRLGVFNRITIFLQGQRIYRFAITAVLRAGLIDCFRRLHPDADGFTYGPPMPIGRIDYIFANAMLARTLTNCCVVRGTDAVDRASDHYPVVAEFSL